MKRADLQFKSDIASKERYGMAFLERCVFNGAEQFDEGYQQKLKSMVRRAKDTEDFIELFLADPDTHLTQGYAEMLKRERPERLWKAIRAMFGDRCFSTDSDAGSVKLGNDSFSILVPNGRGDGETRVAVFENRSDFNDNLMAFFTIVNGKFGIYGYDCGDRVDVELDGKYLVYYHDGLVALVKSR